MNSRRLVRITGVGDPAQVGHVHAICLGASSDSDATDADSSSWVASEPACAGALWCAPSLSKSSTLPPSSLSVIAGWELLSFLAPKSSLISHDQRRSFGH